MNAPAADARPLLARVEPRAATACLVLAAALVAFQALASHPVNLWFDVDPASDPFPFPGIAPSTGMAIDAVTVILSALAVVLMRTRIDARGIAALSMAAAGAAVALWHAFSGGDQCWRGLQWIAAMLGATSIAVVLRALPAPDARTARAIVSAVLVAAAVPILWRGLLQVFIEHPATVEAYMANRTEFLAARGWAEGSPQALTYERRLMQAEATGWFGLSNVASSVIGALAVVAGGAAIALWRPRRIGAVLAGIVAAAGFLTVAMTGSKGAIAATAIGVAFPLLALRLPAGARLARVIVALLFLVLPVAAVAARGMAGPSLGERSLLFRAQYADGALKVFAANPVIGVGPAGFGDAYLRVRPALAPEEVQSAHAAWADWIACLGEGGIAWIALLMLLVAWSAVATRAPESDPAFVPADQLTRPRLVAALAMLAAAAFAVVPEIHALDDHALLQRVLAALFASVFAGILVRTAFLPGRALAAALGGAALMLAVHAQVEMTLWWPGAVGWVACMIGAVAGGARPSAEPAASTGDVRRLVLRVGCAGTIAVAAAMLTTYIPQARAAERAVEAAAQPLAEFGRARLGFGPAPARSPADDRLKLAAIVYPDTDLVSRWLVRPSLRAAALSQLAAAVASLGPAAHPEDAERIVDAAMRPFALLPACEAEASAGGLVLEAILASRSPAAVARHDEAAELQSRWADLQVFFNPRSVRGFARLADARARNGDPDGAADAARRALAADDSYALDPLRQLPAVERARLERIATSPSSAPR